jgi:hypothetical protein
LRRFEFLLRDWNCFENRAYNHWNQHQFFYIARNNQQSQQLIRRHKLVASVKSANSKQRIVKMNFHPNSTQRHRTPDIHGTSESPSKLQQSIVHGKTAALK